MLEDEIMEYVVNNCINDARVMVRQIDHARGVTDNLEDIKTLVFAAMVAYYGIDHVDDVYLAFLKTDFVECDDNIGKVIARKYGLSDDFAMRVISHCPGTFYAVDGTKNLATNKYKLKRSIYVSTDIDVVTLVSSVVHQVNHVINSIHHPLLKKRGSCGSRMGISFEYFDSRKIEVLELEDAINQLQRDQIIDEVKRFGYYNIQDSGVKAICDCFFESVKDDEKTVDDDCMMGIVKPLYQDDLFNTVLVDGRLNGNLARIRDEFDSVVGKGSFSDFLTLCDGLSKTGDFDIAMKCEEDAKILVKTYISKRLSDD